MNGKKIERFQVSCLQQKIVWAENNKSSVSWGQGCKKYIVFKYSDNK